MKLNLAAVALILFGFAGESQASSSVFVYVDIPSQTMTVMADEPDVSYEWQVSTGMPGYPTPGGTFEPQWLSKTHSSSIYENAPMPYAVFFDGDYAIHGTLEVKRLGRPVSHGCVRLAPRNAKLLFNLIQQVGMENVMIHIEP